ncbi:MAG: TldD/PmbA family protein [Bdellovibrionales bacterium]|nr:TldD/PmbA family protein [Bdellovibrionales bacterium]
MSLTPEQSIEAIAKLAKSKSVAAEALIIESNNFKVSYNEGKIDNYDVAKSRSLGVRIVDGQHEGISYTESLKSEDIETAFNEAMENKQFVVADYDPQFPAQPAIKNATDYFNPSLAEVPVAEKLELAKKLESCAKQENPKVHSLPYSNYGDVETSVWLFNTKGTNSYYKKNTCYAYAYPLCVSGEKRGMAYAAEVSRSFADISAERIAKKSVATSLLKLTEQKPKSGNYSVVLQSKAAQTLISLVMNHLSLKAVDLKMSALAGKLGEKIFSEKLTLVDDAITDKGMGSRPFDAEGTKSQVTSLVDKGVLQTYLTSFGYAKKHNLPNTGHATRSPKSGIEIHYTNLMVSPGPNSFSDLVNMDSSVLVIDNLKGLAGVNPISGDFSIESEGLFYRNGEFQHAAANFTLSGNLFEVLKNIEALGNDIEPSTENIYTPSLFVGKMSVAGA